MTFAPTAVPSSLAAKVDAIETYARAHLWDTAREAIDVDGCSAAVMLVGAHDSGRYGFGVGFGINADTGRIVTLALDGKNGARFTVTLEDGSGRYWYGPLSHHRKALADPGEWTGTD